MTEQELIEFLKSNLRITIEGNTEWDYDSMNTNITVKLFLGDEEISREYTSF